MARITAGLTTSHIPAIGAAIDLGKTGEPYWKPLFAGYEWTKAWAARSAWPRTTGTGRGPYPSSAGLNSSAQPSANVGTTSGVNADAWSL